MKQITRLLLCLGVAVLLIPQHSFAQGWGTPIGLDEGEDTSISPKKSSGFNTIAPIETKKYKTQPKAEATSGWGAPNLSPGQGMMDNPWFRASDMLPNPDEYKAPKKAEVARIKDNIQNPTVVWVETFKKDGKAQRANFKSLYIDAQLYVPVIVLPRMFKTKVQWKAASQRLYIFRGSSSLTFSLHDGLQIRFFGEDIDFNARLYHYEKMLYVPVVKIGEFFKYKAFYSYTKKLLNCIKRVQTSKKLVKKWQKTLKKHNLDNYANKIEKARPSTSVSGTKQVFKRIWATSEEPQKIACPGLRGDWYLRADDMGVALPSRKPLMKKVYVRHCKTGKVALATVVDVGPWNINDPYWLKQGGRPEVEKTVYDNWGRKSNLAGIDLSYAVWVAIGVPRATAYGGNYSAYVDWWFAD